MPETTKPAREVRFHVTRFNPETDAVPYVKSYIVPVREGMTVLDGLHYIKNIRKAMEFDRVLESVKTAVVIGATPLGVEMAGNLGHRGIETHFVD